MRTSRSALTWGIGQVAKVALLLAASTGVAASSTIYEIVPGSGLLTAVTIGTSNVDLLGPDVALDNTTTLTAAFDATTVQLENLFVSATGPGQINLTNGSTLIFRNATLQSNEAVTGSGGPVYAFNSLGAQVNALFSLNGSPLQAYSSLVEVSGTVATLDTIDVKLFGVTLGQTTDGQDIKADFSFSAHATSGSTAIPEPGSGLLFGAGMLILGWAMRATGVRAA